MMSCHLISTVSFKPKRIRITVSLIIRITLLTQGDGSETHNENPGDVTVTAAGGDAVGGTQVDPSILPLDLASARDDHPPYKNLRSSSRGNGNDKTGRSSNIVITKGGHANRKLSANQRVQQEQPLQQSLLQQQQEQEQLQQQQQQLLEQQQQQK